MIKDISEIIPEYKYTPEERALEHKLAHDEREKINKMDISETEKEAMRGVWLDYIFLYDLEYKARQKVAIKKSLSMLN